MRIGEIPWAAVTGGDFHCYAFRKIFSQVLLRELQNFVAFLFGNQPKCQFRHRMTGNHRFGPLPLIAAADSIDLCRWTGPNTLHRIVTGLAEKFRHAGLLANQFVTIDWKFPPRFALPIFERLYAIVESRDGHTTFAIVKGCEQLRERGDWIRNGPTENTGMQIHLRPSELDL